MFNFALPLASVSAYVNFGLRGQVGQIAQYFNYRLDALILGGFAGVAPVGIYAISTSLAEVVSYVSNAAATVAFPRFAEAVQRPAQVSRIVRSALAAAATTAVLAGVGGTWDPAHLRRQV